MVAAKILYFHKLYFNIYVSQIRQFSPNLMNSYLWYTYMFIFVHLSPIVVELKVKIIIRNVDLPQ